MLIYHWNDIQANRPVWYTPLACRSEYDQSYQMHENNNKDDKNNMDINELQDILNDPSDYHASNKSHKSYLTSNQNNNDENSNENTFKQKM